MFITRLWDSAFRRHGSFVADWPVLTVAVAYILSLQCGLGWTRLGTEHGVATRNFLLWQWNDHSVPHAKALDQAEKDWFWGTNTDWSTPGSLWFALPTHETKFQDLITLDIFEELWKVWHKWWSITVVTSLGNEYSTHDLCVRSPSPDGIGYPVMPCFNVAVFDCFSEAVMSVHPSYKMVEAVLVGQTKMADPTSNMKTYAEKPSFRSSTPKQLKQALSSCVSGSGFPFTPETLVPQARIVNKQIIAGNMFSTFLLYEGKMLGAWRGKFSKPGPMTDTERAYDFREAVDLHARVLESMVLEEAKHIKPLWYAIHRDDEYLNAYTNANILKPEFSLMMASLGLIILFQFTLVSFRFPSKSRLQLSLFGLFLVILSTMCSMGLYLRLGFDATIYIVLMIPFLSMGVGFDDVFVIMFGITEIDSSFFESNATATIVGELFARVGRGVTLSTACTCIAFGLGCTIQIPAIMNFSVCIVICSLLNWFHMMTSFGVAVSCEVHRLKERLPEAICCPCQLGLCCCCCKKCGAGSSDSPVDEDRDWACGAQAKFLNFLYGTWAPLLAKPIVALFVALVGAGGAAFGIYQMANVVTGFRPGHFLMGTVADAGEAYFSIMRAASLQFVILDVDVPGRQKDLLDMFNEFADNKYCQKDGASNALDTYNSQVFPIVLGGLLANPATAQMGQLLQMADLRSEANMDMSLPGGLTKRDLWYQMWHNFADLPDTAYDAALKLAAGDTLWNLAAGLGVNTFSYYDHPVKNLRRFKMFYFSIPVQWPDIRELPKVAVDFQKILNNWTLPPENEPRCEGDQKQHNLALCTPAFKPEQVVIASTFYESMSTYPQLVGLFWRLLPIDLAVIFVVTALLLGSLAASLVTSVVCFAVVLEVVGICLLYADFQAFTCLIGLAALGIAVEDIAHNVCAFTVEPGSLEHRLGTAMRVTFVPTYQGSLSTMLGLIPVAWSSNPLAVDFLLLPFVGLVCCGFFNGMVIGPSICSLIGNLMVFVNGRTRKGKQLAYI